MKSNVLTACLLSGILFSTGSVAAEAPRTDIPAPAQCDIGPSGPGPLSLGAVASCLLLGTNVVVVAGYWQKAYCQDPAHDNGNIIVVAGDNNTVSC
jgi:hypothetical protein